MALHRNLEKTDCVKAITARPDYDFVIDKTDIITEVGDNKLLILRANGKNCVLNCDYIIAAVVRSREWI
jgi:hypothetical protein